LNVAENISFLFPQHLQDAHSASPAPLNSSSEKIVRIPRFPLVGSARTLLSLSTGPPMNRTILPLPLLALAFTTLVQAEDLSGAEGDDSFKVPLSAEERGLIRDWIARAGSADPAPSSEKPMTEEKKGGNYPRPRPRYRRDRGGQGR